MTACRRWSMIFLALLLAPAAALAADAPHETPGNLSFTRDVRPLLSDTCFQCHGPDEKNRHAGLRLDPGDKAREAGSPRASAVCPVPPAGA